MEPHKIEENLYDLLIKENKEKNREVVISISGEWGFGKTYFWNHFINKYKDLELKDKQIAYVSLFGISSLNDIKTSILLQASPTKNKISWFDKKIVAPLKNVKSSLKLDDLSMSFGFDALGSIFTLLTTGDFKNVIVCFDDFERMSSSVNLKDVLGLISELKEQKNCKVVMILNEKELEKLTDIEKKPYSEIFSLYKEKIIDYDFVYEPTLEENVKIAIKKQGFVFEQKIILKNLQKFNIKNIRVLEQIFRKLKVFEFIIDKSYHKNVIDEFLDTTLAILGFIVKDGKKVEDYLKKKSEHDVSQMSDEEFKNVNLTEFGKSIFVSNDEIIEKVILDYLRSNKINKELLINILDEKNIHLKRYEIKQEIQDKWINLHIDFSYSKGDFLEDIKKIILENQTDIHSILSIDEFHSYIQFINTTSHKVDKAMEESIVKQYIDKYIKLEKSISIHETYRQDFVKSNYPDLIKYWNEKQKKELVEDISSESIEEILKKVKTGWGSKDEFILNNLSSDIYKKFILKSPSFTKNIISFLTSKRNDTGHFTDAIKNIKLALNELRDENDDYKFKVEKILKETGIVSD